MRSRMQHGIQGATRVVYVRGHLTTIRNAHVPRDDTDSDQV